MSSEACDRYRPRLLVRLAGVLMVCNFAILPSVFARDVSEPDILPREGWGALPPNIVLMQEQKPGEIVIHHTGERQQPKVSLEAKMRGLQSFSIRPGRVGSLSKPAWGDILYHYYVDVAGKIGEGRDINFAGDSTTNFDNDGRIQITVEGDFEREEPTKEQLDALMKLVTWLALKYGIPPDGISGHGDHDQTDCPGEHLKPFLADLKKAVAVQAASSELKE